MLFITFFARKAGRTKAEASAEVGVLENMFFLEQVTRDPVSVLADSPAALLLNLNDQDLAQQYFVEELQRAGDKVVYQLTPNDDSLYQALVLEFLGDLPLSVGVIDTLDQQTRITLRNVRLNQPATAVFEFTLPPGVDLLDNREP